MRNQESRPIRSRLLFFICYLSFAFVAGAAAAEPLGSNELLLIYNGQDADSRELAAYYAKVRGVPRDRLLAVTVDTSREEMSAEDFDTLIRQPVRAHLEEHQLQDQVRCLLTFYGVPIRVAGIESSPAEQELLGPIRRQFITALGELERATQELARNGPAVPRPAPWRPPTEEEYPAILRRYAQLRMEMTQRLSRPAANAPEAARQQQELLLSIQDIEGVAALIGMLRPAEGQEPAAAQHLEELRRGMLAADSRLQEILPHGPLHPEREEARRLTRHYYGLIGLLRLLESDLLSLRTEETQAAVDSELALLWWDHYPKYRWMPNLLHWGHRAEGVQPSPGNSGKVLMVSRLDGPGPQVVRRMIDDSLTAERQGLKGRVYIDARGLQPDAGHGRYDQNLRDLALTLWKETDLVVRLDNNPDVFGPGECPETMLYSGWYSLRNYVDSFTFVPGAVAVHIASFEAISIRRPGEKGWCKNLLESGAAATMGPVAEPYLQAFPLPREFFGLLLTGRFTLAECYAYTAPFNSWMMMLLGDPLYRPFAVNPVLTVEQVFPPERIPPEVLAPQTDQTEPADVAGS